MTDRLDPLDPRLPDPPLQSPPRPQTTPAYPPKFPKPARERNPLEDE